MKMDPKQILDILVTYIPVVFLSLLFLAIIILGFYKLYDFYYWAKNTYLEFKIARKR